MGTKSKGSTSYIRYLRRNSGFLMDEVAKKCNYQCQMCKVYSNNFRSFHEPSGHELYLLNYSTTEFLTVDHIVALIDGGTNDLENLQALCRKCNSIKNSKHPTIVKNRIKDFITYKDHSNGIMFHEDDYRCCVCRMQADKVGYRAYVGVNEAKRLGTSIRWEHFIINKNFNHYLTRFSGRTWCNVCCSRFGSGVIPTWFTLEQQGFYS